MRRMNPSSYGPTEPHLWLVGKIPTRTWDNCRETSESKARTHSYHDLVDLFIELTPSWTSICANICEGRPLRRSLLEGGCLNPTLTLGKAVVGSCSI